MRPVETILRETLDEFDGPRADTAAFLGAVKQRSRRQTTRHRAVPVVAAAAAVFALLTAVVLVPWGLRNDAAPDAQPAGPKPSQASVLVPWQGDGVTFPVTLNWLPPELAGAKPVVEILNSSEVDSTMDLDGAGGRSLFVAMITKEPLTNTTGYPTVPVTIRTGPARWIPDKSGRPTSTLAWRLPSGRWAEITAEWASRQLIQGIADSAVERPIAGVLPMRPRLIPRGYRVVTAAFNVLSICPASCPDASAETYAQLSLRSMTAPGKPIRVGNRRAWVTTVGGHTRVEMDRPGVAADPYNPRTIQTVTVRAFDSPLSDADLIRYTAALVLPAPR